MSGPGPFQLAPGEPENRNGIGLSIRLPMKKVLRTYQHIFLTACLTCLSVLVPARQSLSETDSCRVTEEATLASMSSTELVKTYCEYERVAALESNHLERLRELYRVAPSSELKDLENNMDRDIENRADCSEARRTIRAMLRARGASEIVTCGE